MFTRSCLCFMFVLKFIILFHKQTRTIHFMINATHSLKFGKHTCMPVKIILIFSQKLRSDKRCRIISATYTNKEH